MAEPARQRHSISASAWHAPPTASGADLRGTALPGGVGQYTSGVLLDVTILSVVAEVIPSGAPSETPILIPPWIDGSPTVSNYVSGLAVWLTTQLLSGVGVALWGILRALGWIVRRVWAVRPIVLKRATLGRRLAERYAAGKSDGREEKRAELQPQVLALSEKYSSAEKRVSAAESALSSARQELDKVPAELQLEIDKARAEAHVEKDKAVAAAEASWKKQHGNLERAATKNLGLANSRAFAAEATTEALARKLDEHQRTISGLREELKTAEARAAASEQREEHESVQFHPKAPQLTEDSQTSLIPSRVDLPLARWRISVEPGQDFVILLNGPTRFVLDNLSKQSFAMNVRVNGPDEFDFDDAAEWEEFAGGATHYFAGSARNAGGYKGVEFTVTWIAFSGEVKTDKVRVRPWLHMPSPWFGSVPRG
jgi:hypothetical protein